MDPDLFIYYPEHVLAPEILPYMLINFTRNQLTLQVVQLSVQELVYKICLCRSCVLEWLYVGLVNC